MATYSDEYSRFLAYGTQLVEVHVDLRDLLDDLREGAVPGRLLGARCVTFCTAVTRHHTGEDREVFPLLAERHPELRSFLDGLRRDHEVIAGMLARLPESTGAELDAIAAVLETHFIGEEKRLTGVLNALDTSVGLTPFAEALEFQ
ncbi:hemerythrin domain-containing protein [Actinoplanes sp. NPDC051494]|uniref:hemerythrin domain-containing protein n=1 Tax=Actinoplanes sp. NPDC051494 TaxID=3363907 RepID=UPI0037B42642